ncbi:exosortase/archaeosortase family protein [Kitasatospora sp. NPDC050543]|uniref:exosortase/archaeosortase family protein n=1 Tax=Kitasatospora sp. NPDC050543 TaxID=3364054 RepID=UPI00379067F6
MADVDSPARRQPDPGTGPRTSAARSFRLFLSGLLILGALLLLVFNDRFRSLEAVVAGPVIHLGLGGEVEVVPRFAAVFFDAHTWRMEGLRITSDCTAAVVIAPFLALAGVVISFRRFRIGRVLAGVGFAAAILFLVNQLRLLLIAYATHEWGLNHGYGWSHLLVGSVVTSAGAVVAVAVFFLLVSRTGAGRRSAHAHGGTRGE